MLLTEALRTAYEVKSLLEPHCDRIEIAGSIRRRRPEVKDIEIVAIPKPYETGLFASGIALVVNQWEKVKGELPCKYTQRTLPQGIKLDLFFAHKDNWGLIYAMRTGSADYSHHVLAAGWVRHGYHSMGGQLVKGKHIVSVSEEKDLFRMAGVPYTAPELREFTPKKYFR